MAKEITFDDDTTETMFTAEEMAAKDAEIAEFKRVAAERGENFSKFSKKTEELESTVNVLKTTLEEKNAKDRDSAKNNTAFKYHGGNEEIKTKLEGNYAVLSGMPETTAEEIAARVDAAARLSGINIESRNPLYTPTYGEAPKPKADSQTREAQEQEFLKSERGQAALKVMGLEEPAKTE